MCGGERLMTRWRMPSQLLSTFCSRQGLSVDLKLRARDLQSPLSLPPLHWDYTCVLPCPIFSHACARALNSGHHALVASPLPTLPSLQPLQGISYAHSHEVFLRAHIVLLRQDLTSVAQADLELATILNFWFSRLYLPRAGIPGMCHHATTQ